MELSFWQAVNNWKYIYYKYVDSTVNLSYDFPLEVYTNTLNKSYNLHETQSIFRTIITKITVL